MVGGGSRRDDGSLVINNTNVFAALESLRKKKKSDKERKSKGSKSQSVQPKEPEPQVFWAPAPLNSKSWADVDDEDDDDYYATTAPPPTVWGSSDAPESKETPSNVEESESEEDILDEADDDIEDEHEHDNEHEPEIPVHPEPVLKKPAEASVAPKEAERQLSKKERKKKELAELDALLADFGVNQKEGNSQDESRDVQEKTDEESNGVVGEKKENAPAESKSAKKKKKKDKASKEVKDSDVATGPDEAAGNEDAEEDASAVDVKERIKKMTAMKKKKSSKEMDSSAKAAALEAAARSARLAAAKKKDKNHYNQQPVR